MGPGQPAVWGVMLSCHGVCGIFQETPNYGVSLLLSLSCYLCHNGNGWLKLRCFQVHTYQTVMMQSGKLGHNAISTLTEHIIDNENVPLLRLVADEKVKFCLLPLINWCEYFLVV